jgi:hypothetical protein
MLRSGPQIEGQEGHGKHENNKQNVHRTIKTLGDYGGERASG